MGHDDQIPSHASGLLQALTADARVLHLTKTTVTPVSLWAIWVTAVLMHISVYRVETALLADGS